MSKVVQGIYQVDGDYIEGKEELERVCIHEVFRVF
jgi:hypothetical protein